MKNKNWETKEEALLNNTFDRLDFQLWGYWNWKSWLLWTQRNRLCRFCEWKIWKTKWIKCNTWNNKHVWEY
jgi:hypothetical protein